MQGIMVFCWCMHREIVHRTMMLRQTIRMIHWAGVILPTTGLRWVRAVSLRKNWLPILVIMVHTM